jgi:hypothetical protein
MSAILQVMHQKNENVGVLGRLNFWYLPSPKEFLPPRNSKLVSDIASIDHLLLIAHEVFQYCPEFRFKKHTSDVAINGEVGKLNVNLSLMTLFLNFILYIYISRC